METQLKKSDIFVVAAWTTLVTSLPEGSVWVWTRAYPALNAAHKVTPDVLWVAPVLNLACNFLLCLVLLPVLTLLEKKFGVRAWRGVYGFFLTLGIYLAITTPQMIHPLGALAMSLGLAVVLCRQLKGREERMTVRLRRWVWCVPAIVLLVWLGVRAQDRIMESARSGALPGVDPKAPNVLILVMDTVRSDRFLPHHAQTLTPNFDRLAAGGVRFDNAWSTSSWSLPSQVSILTGLYPHEHEGDWPTVKMLQSNATLPELFLQRGYVTGAFSGNAAWITPEYMGRGFLRFRVYILEDLFRRTTLGRKFDKLLEHVGYHSAGRGKKAARVNSEFVQFLQDYPDRPFFAYLCYMDVNQEMHESRMNQHKPMPQVMKDYDAALTRLDARIGELLAELQKRGRLENTFIMITSDHGESFGQKHAEDHDPSGHGSSLYREQIAVPLAVYYPGRIPADLTSMRTVSIREIPATVMDLLGWENSPFSGEPLSRAWQPPDSTGAADPAVYAEIRHLDGKEIQASVFHGAWQFVDTPRDFEALKKREELFDFSVDAMSKRSLTDEPLAQPVLIDLRERLRLFHSSGKQKSASSRPAP